MSQKYNKFKYKPNKNQQKLITVLMLNRSQLQLIKCIEIVRLIMVLMLNRS